MANLMNVGFSFDNNLVLPIINTINSILENNKAFINFYFIVDNAETFKNINKNELILIREKYTNYSITDQFVCYILL